VDPVDKLIALLDGRPTLLILDNCEHLIDACAELAEALLGSSAALRIITTSREALGLIGETVYPVKTLGNESAVALFLDRAHAASPDLAIDDADQAVVAEICRRLDGLPLAIELAAARLRTMPLAEIATRLDDRFRLLTGGSRTALPRQRTLKAVVEWSWALLDEQDRELAEELVVFTGGFDFQAADAVHRALGGRSDLLETLSSLVEKSLIAMDSARVGRYRILETIREFGRDRLIERGTLSRVRRAHAEYFAQLARRTEPELNGRNQLEALATLKTERDNLFAALTHLSETGEASAALQLAISMSWYSMLLGSRTTAAAWLETALAAEGEATVQERAAAAVFLHINELVVGWADADISKLERAYESLCDTPAQEQEPSVLMLRVLARLFLIQSVPRQVTDLTTPDEELNRLITIGLGQDSPWSQASMLLLRSSLAENSGEFASATDDVEEAIRRFESLGDRWGLGGSYETAARLRIYSGDLVGAKAALELGYRNLSELGAQEDAANSLIWMAIAQLRGGEFTEAVASLARIDEFPEALAAPELQGIGNFVRAEVARLYPEIGWDPVALNDEAFEQAGGEVTGAGAPQLVALLMTQRAMTALAEGRTADAETALRQAGSRAGQVSDMPIFAGFVVGVADLEAHQGNHRRAAVLLAASAVIRGATDPADRDECRIRARITAAIGAEELADATAEGLALSRREAVQSVLQYFSESGTSDPAAVGADGEREEHGE
ncbi:hypothetical protein D1871_21895, partial [Nakamurella silvestris]